MTTGEARRILLLYRPGVDDARDAEVAAALALAETDPELKAWYANHAAFQRALREKLRSVEAPTALRENLLAGRKIIRPAFWQRPPAWLLAAAALVLLIGVAALMLRSPVPDRFADYRTRMVRSVLREYHMDIVTNDMAQVRSFMASRGAPADYEVTPGLAKLSLTGAGLMQWRGHPVSMVCFDRGGNHMLYLFVLRNTALRDAPASTPTVERVSKLATVSWSKGDKTYVLAGPEEEQFVEKYQAGTVPPGQ